MPYEEGAVRYGKDGITPMSIEEWTDNLVHEAPHLFEISAGSGASTNGPGGAGLNDKNPWTKEHWNLTRQGEIFKRDPIKAEQLKRSAKR